MLDYLGIGPAVEAAKKKESTSFRRLTRRLKTQTTAKELEKDYKPKTLKSKATTTFKDSIISALPIKRLKTKKIVDLGEGALETEQALIGSERDQLSISVSMDTSSGKIGERPQGAYKS